MPNRFELGQDVYRISWNKGVKIVEVGSVTKTSRPKHYYVNNEPKTASGWSSSPGEAFKSEYQYFFNLWSFNPFWEPKRPEGFTIEKTVDILLKVRKLQKSFDSGEAQAIRLGQSH